MRKHFLLKTMLLLCALIVGSSSAWAQVSSVAPADGKSYVVAAYVNSKYYALGTASVSGKTITGKEVTLNSYSKVSTEDADGLTWTLEQNAETPSQFYIKCVRSNKTYYLYKNGTGNTNYNFATNSETTKNYWSFTANSAGTAYTVAAIGRGSNNIYIQYYSGAFRCYSTASDIILLEIGDTPNVDITVAVNPSNESMGTASISGTTITASPNPGYRVSTTTPYSVSPSNAATVVQTGNSFAVTATANCTITINFEAIPTHTLSSAVNPANAGSVVLGASSVCEGANTTIEATANSGYEFTEWEVSGDGATIVDKDAASTTITMGTADATVTAKFTAVTTHEINWSVNGTIVKTDNVKEGNDLDFSAPTSGIPAGYTFMGWSASTIASPQATAEGITYVTEGTSTADITYYAVLAISNATTVTLAASHTSANTTYGDHTYTDDAGNEWSGNTNEPYENSVARIGLRSTSGSYLESPTFSENITDIKIMTYNGSSTSDRTFNLKSTKDGATADLGTVTAPKGFLRQNQG